jgi:hypothetical protein
MGRDSSFTRLMAFSVKMFNSSNKAPGRFPVEKMMEDFYGSASEPMNRYWHHMDRAWIEAGEYAGCAFGYMRIFTPEVMAQARSLIDEAVASCKTIQEFRRVQLADESLALHELFMKLRRDLAEGRLHHLKRDADQWRASARHLQRRYKEDYCFGTAVTYNYFDLFFAPAYEDMDRIRREYTVYARPIREWKVRPDPEKEAVTSGWHEPDYDDRKWRTTDTAVETWSSLGHHNTMGVMVYRTGLRSPRWPEGKKVYLWLASTDGSARLFVNGTHVPYVNEKGEAQEAFSGYCRPASFEITEAFRPGGPNQVTLICERRFLNELGTGGLLGPAYVYCDR